MGLVLAPMDDVQRVVAADVAMALGVEDWTALRAQLLAAERNRVWLAPPLLSVAAALLTVVTAWADASPWAFTDDLWDRYFPDCKPVGRTDWRKASFAVQAAGCLAGGVWLDVGVTESFWHSPLWPDVLLVVDLLRRVARDLSELAWPELAVQVLELLAFRARLHPSTDPAPVSPIVPSLPLHTRLRRPDRLFASTSCQLHQARSTPSKISPTPRYLRYVCRCGRLSW